MLRLCNESCASTVDSTDIVLSDLARTDRQTNAKIAIGRATACPAGKLRSSKRWQSGSHKHWKAIEIFADTAIKRIFPMGKNIC